MQMDDEEPEQAYEDEAPQEPQELEEAKLCMSPPHVFFVPFVPLPVRAILVFLTSVFLISSRCAFPSPLQSSVI